VQLQLDTRLREHLAHEERAALPLIDRTLTAAQWAPFGTGSTERIGADMRLFLPWMLDGADEATTAHLLGMIPAPVRQAYADDWLPAYSAIDRWATTGLAAKRTPA
jgi:hypothetical protein